MTERPQQLDRLDIMLAGVDIAHTVIFDMHRELLGSQSAQTESASLLAESAALTTVRAPQLTESLRASRGDGTSRPCSIRRPPIGPPSRSPPSSPPSSLP
jgi:hypothetical protein